MGRTMLVVLVLAVVAGGVGRLASPPQVAHGGAVQLLCGSERWTSKTLQDRPALIAAQTKSIGYLVTRKKPSPLPATRAPFEYEPVARS